MVGIVIMPIALLPQAHHCICLFQIQELVDANHIPKAELGIPSSSHNNGSVNNPTVEITPGTPPMQNKYVLC